MPKKCCVIGCRSGYDGNKEKVSTFKFPNDQNLKKKWLEAIGRNNYKPTQYSSVCHKHFIEDDVIRHCVGIDSETGAEILLPARVRLKDGAVPVLNLSNRIDPKASTKTLNRKGKTTRKSKRGRPQKSVKPKSDHSSSDEDIPLETLKNRRRGSKDKDSSSPDQMADNKSDEDQSTLEKKALVQRFFDLLDKYEKLKDRHVALGHEIEVLEKVNINLKCKIFQF